MSLPKPLRWVLYIVGGLTAVLILIFAVLAFVQIPLDLTRHKGLVESIATRAVGRTVKVDTKIGVTTSLWPVFTLEGLRIGNPKGFQEGDFAQMKTAKIQVSVLPLLLGKIHIGTFKVKGLFLDLVESKEGAVNWSTRAPSEADPKEPVKPKEEPKKGKWELASDSLVIEKLMLADISVRYRNSSMVEPLEFRIDDCTGAALAGKPFAFDMKGTLLEQPFSTTIQAASLQQLLEESRSWMDIKTEIAETTVELAGALDLSQALKTLQMKVSVKGERLDSLNELLKLDLPPLKSYGAGGLLSMRKGKLDLSDFEIYVGQSKLTGKMAIDKAGFRPVVTIELDAPMIQLNDFDVGNWPAEKSDPEPPTQQEAKSKKTDRAVAKEPKKVPDAKTDGDGQLAELLSPEFLGSFDAQMKVKVEKVLSGADELGSGLLTVTLKQGRFSIDPVKLNIPGGSFFFVSSVKPGRTTSEASVLATMKNFDFGVLARRSDPETNMGGVINLDVDLKSSAKSFDDLLANGNGYFDFSARPVNLRAGIVDLWAVNVIAAIASKGEKEASKINCLVGRWSMEEGLLKPEAFVIDTSKIRICGKGQVNFKTEQIDLKVAPTPKRPEFFSLATPLEVKGKFSDFGVGVQTGGLFGTSIRFITSPITVPLRRLAGKGLPTDGEDICGMTIGPDDRPTTRPPGCR
jgi:uncharacterized protein involved in outer membrane biogenesis